MNDRAKPVNTAEACGENGTWAMTGSQSPRDHRFGDVRRYGRQPVVTGNSAQMIAGRHIGGLDAMHWERHAKRFRISRRKTAHDSNGAHRGVCRSWSIETRQTRTWRCHVIAVGARPRDSDRSNEGPGHTQDHGDMMTALHTDGTRALDVAEFGRKAQESIGFIVAAQASMDNGLPRG